MCGIIAKFGKPFNKDEMLNIYETIDNGGEGFMQRGEDAFGMLAINTSTGEYEIMKYCSSSNDDILEFIAEISVYNFNRLANRYNFFVYHNRWASIGGKTDIELAHPIEEDNWIVAHNGTNSDAKILYAKSDTDGFAKYIFDMPSHIRKQFLDDSGVIFAYDKLGKKIFLHNDKSRSLFFTEDDGGIFSSEPLHSFSSEWFAVNNIEDIEELSNVTFSYAKDISKIISAKKITSTSNDCCYKKSSNSIKIDNKTYCYNCLSEADYDIKNIVKAKKSSNVTYYNGYVGVGGY